MINQHFSIIWGRRKIKYSQLCAYIASAIKQLKGLGIRPYDRVAICDENSVEYIILLLALWQMKVVAAPISPRWPDKTVASYAARINTKHVLCSTEIKRVIAFDTRHAVTPSPVETFDLDQELTILATSGSSGQAKAVVHTWGNHYYSALGSNEIIPLQNGDSWLLSLPLYHVSGMSILVRCLLSGAALGVGAGGHWAQALNDERITHISLVPTQYYRLLANPADHDKLRQLKCILLGGSAIPSALIELSTQLGIHVYLTYGLTEMSSQVATGRVTHHQNAYVKVLPYRKLCISPEGEILVKGEVLCKGYVAGRKLDLPLKSYHDEAWFATGDMGTLSEEGCLTVVGRRDNMFISGGENIHPEEIEKLLLDIPGIMEAIVVPCEDKEFGHRPVAFIKSDGKGLKHDDLLKHLEADLPRFKIPVAFYPWPQELMTHGIKTSRQEFLRALPQKF